MIFKNLILQNCITLLSTFILCFQIINSKIYDYDPSEIVLQDENLSDIFKYSQFQKPSKTMNFMHNLYFRKYLFSTAYKSVKSCNNKTVKTDEKHLYLYIIVKRSSNITNNSHIIIILNCIFNKLGYSKGIILYSEDDSFCSKKKVQEKNVLFIYLVESSKAKVYTNSNFGYKSGIDSIETTPPCVFIPSGDGKIFITLNIIGKIYKYNSYDIKGRNVMKYGQYVTFLDDAGVQDNFLATISDSSTIDLKPFVEVTLQTDTGFSYFSKKSFSIKNVLFDYFDSISFLINTPDWFKSRRKVITMLPIHRYIIGDIKPQTEGFDNHRKF
uniref:Secreted ookinete protein n=1 Tax=Strongyloides stercoralis TaxID=6248 RepID=A0A0K0DXW0_STRER